MERVRTPEVWNAYVGRMAKIRGGSGSSPAAITHSRLYFRESRPEPVAVAEIGEWKSAFEPIDAANLDLFEIDLQESPVGVYITVNWVRFGFASVRTIQQNLGCTVSTLF